ncbi:MAG: M14 family metallopeptidase [Myxococcota bacterium]|nr:M14 family metallopeptidase [Myxococcota bacterium]
MGNSALVKGALLCAVSTCVAACYSESDRSSSRSPATPVTQRSPQPSDADTRSNAVEIDPEALLTIAEKTDFTATSTLDQTVAFLKQLLPHLPEMKLSSFGTSAEGREMPLVIISKERAFTPEKARATGKPILLIQNGIHAGEIDGKDACLMMLRDLVLGKHRWILDVATLLIVPIYNVDGHERISPYNRPNQDGPLDGMGFRTTTQGLDLNRDHIKLVSPEARALVRLFNKWLPNLHVDNHVTDGCDHDWVLTYAWCEAPQLAPPIHEWIANHMPAVMSALEKRGHQNGPYVWLNDSNDPEKGFKTGVASPRLSTAYFALRNRPSILIEMHAYKPYKQRVMANRDFLIELIREIGASPRHLIDAVQRADAIKTTLGKPGAVPSDMVLSYEIGKVTEPLSFPIYKSHLAPSIVTGKPMIRYERGLVDEKEVPWSHGILAQAAVPRPRGYLLLRGWPQIEARLEAHGITVLQLTEPVEVSVETMRIKNPRYEKDTYQGEIRVQVDVARTQETRQFTAGTLWIPADQPDFEVAAQLLEPEAPDSLVQWGKLRSILEIKTYVSPQVLEARAAELIKDPEIAQAWKQALKDKVFAKDQRARHRWWYRRTKYWDTGVGLLPAMRVMENPTFTTRPWQPHR